MVPPALTVAVLGAPGLADRLAHTGLAVTDHGADAVVVGGPAGDRVAAAREAVSGGTPVFLLWPPGISAPEADALAARAEEAGVEVGVGRPLGASALLAGRPHDWRARLVTLSLVAAPGGAFAAAGGRHLLAGALDVCATLAASRDVARLDAEADRDGARLRALALMVRFRTGALAQISLRTSEQAAHDDVALFAAGPGARVEARSFAGPLCVEADGRATVLVPPASPDADVAEVLAFVDAVGAGRPAPYPLDAALDTLRLAERVQGRLR